MLKTLEAAEVPLSAVSRSLLRVSLGVSLVFLLMWVAYTAAESVTSEYSQEQSRSCINFYDLDSDVT